MYNQSLILFYSLWLSASSTFHFDFFFLGRIFGNKLSSLIPGYFSSDSVTSLVLIYLLKVVPYLLVIFLHRYHLFPLLLSHVPHFLYRHNPHFLDLMINLLYMDGMLLHVNNSIAEQSTQLSLTFFSLEHWLIILIDEIDPLISFVQSKLLPAHNIKAKY